MTAANLSGFFGDAGGTLTKLAKARPVVLGSAPDDVEILAFRHPQAGKQLVKGTVDDGDPAEDAALRELREESGIADATVTEALGLSTAGDPGRSWHFVLCDANERRDRWSQFTNDGGGHRHLFFWHPIDEPTDEDWDPVFLRALAFIRNMFARPRVRSASRGRR